MRITPDAMIRPAARGQAACRLALAAVALLLAAGAAPAANTDPTLALVRATAVRGSGGRATLTLETSFSFDDAIQLALPIEVVVTQGTRTARCALSGSVVMSVGGAPQPAASPGVVSVTERSITVVLPAEFGPGEAAAQLVGAYSSKPVASNVLRFAL